MITYIEKGRNLRKVISEQGYSLSRLDGVWQSSDDVAVQAIIDAYDPLPEAKTDANTLVKEASATKRLQFVTQAAGKDAEYKTKEAEAKQFDLDATVGVFMQARMTLTSETAATVAAEWNAKSSAWQAVGAAIAALEDKASADISAETDWQQCIVIANAAVTAIEAI